VGVFHADPHPGNFIALPGNRVGFTDFGRVSTISVESRERLIDLFYAGLRRDEEAGADALLALASNPDVDEVALQRDVARLISQFTNRALCDIDIGDLLTGIITLFRTHRLGMPRDFALMLATMVMLEGMGTTLDPGFDFSKVVAPFVESAIAGRTNLGHLTERLERDMRRGVRMFERMPSQVDRILRRIARGDIRMEVAPRDYETLLERIAELVNRLAFAIVVAASIVGATTLLGIETVPKWMHTFGAIGLVGSVLVSVWFFGSIFSAHYQAKRKRR
jgi:ubiquinone biosynthesis protein